MERSTSGWINGLIGVIIFSGSLPATRVAVQAFDPVFLTVARAGIAGLVGLGLLLAFRQRRPAAGDLGSLAIVALAWWWAFRCSRRWRCSMSPRHIPSSLSGSCRWRRRFSG
jgi:drug/metabolite transporter (DMT)-like permease